MAITYDTPSTRYALKRPLGTPTLVSDLDDAIRAVVDDLDSKMVGSSEGTLASRPASGVHGREYYATDTGQLFKDIGTRWIEPGVLLGEVKWMGVPTAPSGWLECNGQGVTVGANADLHNALVAAGNPHGVDGSGNPKVPDLQDYAPVGVSGTHALGAKFGEATHALTATEMPSHTHTGPSHTHSGSTNNSASLAHSHDYGGLVARSTNVWTTMKDSGTVGSDAPITSGALSSSSGTQDSGGLIHAHSFTTDAGGTGATGSAGGGAAHNNEGRRVALKAYIKA